MKKIISSAAILTLPFVVNAQNKNTSGIDKETFNIIASIFVVALFMIFILAILKRLLDNRVKNKIIDKGIPENIASSILQTNSREDRNINIKWFSVLAGLGIGFTIINYTLPLGFHSLAIMAFSISFSFLGYHFFSKQSEK
jgi:drug/metabolite transporter (DMT)-like permease